MKKFTRSLKKCAEEIIKSRVNGNKIYYYEMRFEYRGEIFKLVPKDNSFANWRLLVLPYENAVEFSEFSEFYFNPFE